MQRKNTKNNRTNNRLPVVQCRVNSTKTRWFDGLRALIKFTKFACLIAIAGWGINFLYTSISRSYRENPEYQLRHINLNANSALNEADVLRITEIPLDVYTSSVDIAKMQTALASRPEITSASVERGSPGTLNVHLEVRKPVAWIECLPKNYIARSRDQGHLIDHHGVLYPCPVLQFDQAQDLPVIEVLREDAEKLIFGQKIDTKGVRRAMSLLAISQAMKPTRPPWIDRIAPYRAWGMRVTTRDHATALLSIDEHERQLRDLLIYLDHAKGTGREIEYINLIPNKNAPVKFRKASQSRRIQ